MREEPVSRCKSVYLQILSMLLASMLGSDWHLVGMDMDQIGPILENLSLESNEVLSQTWKQWRISSKRFVGIT